MRINETVPFRTARMSFPKKNCLLGFEYFTTATGCEARYDRELAQTHPVGPILRISIEDNVEFRLTYAGPLYATQREPAPLQADNRAGHKHQIRKSFHPQLKRLWEITPFLKSGHRSGTSAMLLQGAEEEPVYDIPMLAARHSLYGFNFVPLVTSDLNLICGLDILFLRPDRPGGFRFLADMPAALAFPTLPPERHSGRVLPSFSGVGGLSSNWPVKMDGCCLCASYRTRSPRVFSIFGVPVEVTGQRP
jgi:hypothetical protein